MVRVVEGMRAAKVNAGNFIAIHGDEEGSGQILPSSRNAGTVSAFFEGLVHKTEMVPEGILVRLIDSLEIVSGL